MKLFRTVDLSRFAAHVVERDEPNPTAVEVEPGVWLQPIYLNTYWGVSLGLQSALAGGGMVQRVSDQSASYKRRERLQVTFFVKAADGKGYWPVERLYNVWEEVADLGPYHGPHRACKELVCAHEARQGKTA